MGLQRRQHIDGGLAHQRVVDLLGDLARADKALALQYRQLLGESGLAELAVSQQLPDSSPLHQLAEHQQAFGMSQRLEQGGGGCRMSVHLVELAHGSKLAIADIWFYCIKRH